MQIRIDQEDSEVEFWMRFLGQLVIIPHSWQCVVFKLVWIDSICHIISIIVDADELSSMARSHFDRHCTVKT